jgi:hypothetical protein
MGYYVLEAHVSEADIQAEVYSKAKALGIAVRLEVKIPCDAYRSGFMRCDVAVLDDRRHVIAVIECKRPGKAISPSGRQALGYREFARQTGALVLWCSSMDEVDAVLRAAAAKLKGRDDG